MRFLGSHPFLSATLLLLFLITGSLISIIYFENVPTASTFEQLARSKWESEFKTPSRTKLPNDELCIKPKYWSGLGNTSKRSYPFTWYQEVSPDRPVHEHNIKSLKQVEALSNAGVLNKDELESGVTRYTLSDNGWLTSNYGYKSFCILFGKATFLGVKEYRLNKAKDYVTIDVLYGVPSIESLETWAQEKSIREAFPDIRKALDGIKKTYSFRRESFVWVSTREKNSLLKAMLSKVGSIFSSPTPPLPSEAELRQITSSAWEKNDVAWPGHYIELPPAEKFPVDDQARKRDSSYKVYVYTDPSNSRKKAVTEKTLPYLLQLKDLGVLKMEIVQGMMTSGKHAGQDASAYVFTIADTYKDKIDPLNRNKIMLGAPTTKLVSAESAMYEGERDPILLIKAKFRWTYQTPPEWIPQSGLMDKWSELNNLITKGYACIMTYRYNLNSHQFESSIGGSCWRAYDSMFDS